MFRSSRVSPDYLWIGLGHGETKLARMEKRELLTAPKPQWVSNRVGPKEFAEILARQSPRQQALHAFFAGDHSRTLALLDSERTAPSDLEAMFLRAYCYDPMGLNQPVECRRQFEAIIKQFSDSLWEKVARTALEESERPSDSEWRSQQLEKVIGRQLEGVFKGCDRDSDGKLNRAEFVTFWRELSSFFNLGPSVLAKRAQYDANQDSFIDATELKAMASDLRKEQE